MDIVSHALWTNLLYLRARRYAAWGVLLGVLPDIVSFGGLLLERIFFPEDLTLSQAAVSVGPARLFGRRPTLAQIPPYVFTLYNVTHSLVVFGAVALVIAVLWRQFWWPMLGWALHIASDIFTHTSDFFPTPFLWPLSDFRVSVISWGHPVFFAANAATLIILYGYLAIRRRRQRSQTAPTPVR